MTTIMSFDAFLRYHGREYPLLSCDQVMYQEWDRFGRADSDVYAGELTLTLLPPDALDLPHWANDPRKADACQVVFRAPDGGAPSVTLGLDDAYCLQYVEHFVPGPDGAVAYVAQLRIVARRFDKHGTAFGNDWPPLRH